MPLNIQIATRTNPPNTAPTIVNAAKIDSNFIIRLF